MVRQPQQMICNWIEKITRCKRAHYNYFAPTLSWLHGAVSQPLLSFPSCSKQFSSFADCFIAPALRPINRRLLSRDSDKWKPAVCPYEIVYPPKNTYVEIWKAWLHISYSTSSIQFWIREIALETTLVSSHRPGPQCPCLCCHCLYQEVNHPHASRHHFCTLHDSRVSRVVVHSTLAIGPQPTVVQERRYNRYLLTGSNSRMVHLVVSGLLMSTVCTGPASVSLTRGKEEELVRAGNNQLIICTQEILFI